MRKTKGSSFYRQRFACDNLGIDFGVRDLPIAVTHALIDSAIEIIVALTAHDKAIGAVMERLIYFAIAIPILLDPFETFPEIISELVGAPVAVIIDFTGQLWRTQQAPSQARPQHGAEQQRTDYQKCRHATVGS